MKVKILIVDDIKENIVALSALIASDDIEIYSALNPDDALNLVFEHEFALALLDVQMPSISGFELARLIRGVEKSRHLPIIFVTAEDRRNSIVFEGYETGAVDLLFKPLDPHMVRSKVKVFVTLHQQMKTVSNLKEQAEAANVAKSQFLANMSHEIRTPLGAVLGYSDLIANHPLNEDDKKKFSSAIKRNGQLLMRVIDDILDLSKIEAEKFETNESNFDLKELLKDVELTLKSRAEDKHNTLSFVADGDISGIFKSDPERIKQILLNIVGNAIKFTSKGSVLLTTTLQSVDSDHTNVIFRVQDSGIGLTPDEAARLFKPFTQADSSTSKKFGGTGLGLVISRRLAQLLGGDVKLLSHDKGEGSVFEITVLMKKTKVIVGDIPKSKSFDYANPDLLQGKNFLVVDDKFDNRNMIENFLAPSGATISTSNSGKEAISRMSTGEHFDAVIMDVHMSEMDGLKTTQGMRAQGYKNPILAFTAHAMKSDIESYMKNGFSSVMTKPISIDELLSELVRLTSSK